MHLPASRRGCLLLLLAGTTALAGDTVDPSRLVRSEPWGNAYYFAPPRRVPESLAPFWRHVSPGGDAFPEEKDARELSQRLKVFGARLREGGPARVADALEPLLSAEFRGGRLVPSSEVATGAGSPLEIFRGREAAADLTRDRKGFVAEMNAWLADLEHLHTTELLITAIESRTDPTPEIRTTVRYDIVGSGKGAWRAEFLGQWQLRWRPEAEGTWRVAEWNAVDPLRSRAAAPIFTDVTGTALGGIESMRSQLGVGHDAWLASLDAAFMPDTMALHGISAADVDGDGRDDLYVSQPSGLPNRLFRNRGDGRFEDVTEGSGLDVLDSTSQSLFADLDNDGDADAVLVVRSGLLLFLNDGQGRFTRDAEAFRFESGLRGSPTSATMADYDRDGFLDLYLCTYSYFIGAREDKAGPATPYHDAQNGPPNVLLKNDGHARFVDVTAAVGLNENNDRFSFAAAWGDYDDDGWPDLLVANDFGRKNLYRNLGAANGPLKFKDMAASAGVEDYGAGMSAAWLDYDQDGDLDIYTGNMWTAAGQRVTTQPRFMPDAPEDVRALYRRHTRGNSLFRNRGDGTFEDVTLEARAEMGRWAWSSDAVDFDLDGWEDLYVVNGMLTRDDTAPVEDLDSFFWRQVTARSPLQYRTGTAYDDAWRAINRMLVADGSEAPHERNVFLRNDGRGGFDEVAGSVGLDLDQDGRAFAVLDYDGDGDPDLAVFTPRASPQLRLFRNDRPGGNRALLVRLSGTRSNRDAVGARVTVETDGARLLRTLQAGSGFLSQHSKELIFGLGRRERAAKVTVQWPSGLRQVFTDVPAHQRVTLQEGGDVLRAEPLLSATAVPAEPLPEPLPPPAATWLYEPPPAPDFTLADLAGKKVSLSALRGGPVLLLFWATWAPPSQAAVLDLPKNEATLGSEGLRVLALSVDARENEAQVRAVASAASVPVLMAGDEVAGTYAVLNRFVFARREHLRLPTAFLLNEKGEIVRAYRGAIAAAQVLADLPQTIAPDAARLARSLPFKGTFYALPDRRNEFPYALDLAEQGFETPAMEAFEQAARREPSAMTSFNLATLYLKHRRPAEARAALEQALQLKPDYAEANNSLGALLAQTGDVASGIARFRAALQTKPDFADALNNLGFALFQTGRAKEAHELYEKALALQPDFPEAFNNLGIFYGQQGDLARAAGYFRDALRQRPSYGEAANNLALVLMARQDAAGAVRTLQLLLEQDPAFEMAYVTLAKVYLATGRTRDAGQVLEQLMQRNPSHPLGQQMMRQLRGAR